MKMKITAVCLAIALLAVICASALGEGVTLSVRGTGAVYVESDCATISIGVRMNGGQVAEAQAAANERIDAVITALEGMGVERGDISTSDIGIYVNYDYEGDENDILDYTAYNTLLVETQDVKNVGAYIDAAFAAGANNLDYVSFSAKDTAEAGAKALTLAVQNARDKAEILAQAAGAKLGGILEMQEIEPASYYELPVMAARDEAKAMGTQVLASKQQVNAVVNVVFELIQED